MFRSSPSGFFIATDISARKSHTTAYQEEKYLDSFDAQLALQPVLNENGERILVMVHIRGREVYAQAWLAQIGRISLYLLDTNVSENNEIDRLDYRTSLRRRHRNAHRAGKNSRHRRRSSASRTRRSNRRFII